MTFHSILLTVHNKQDMIKKVVSSITKNTKGPYELLIVFDGCSDDSEKIVTNYLKKYKNRSIKKKYLYANDVFETKANNIGLKECSGDYITIIQDDMIIKENSWNINLSKPFQKYSDVFSVTAHTSHNLGYVEPKNKLEKHGNYYMLNFPDPIGFRTTKEIPRRDEFNIRLTSNRGPLMIDAEYLEKLNFLDEVYAPLTWDDHDLNIRARINYGLVTGYYPIDFVSEVRWGSTRDKNGKMRDWLVEAEKKNMKIIFQRYENIIKQRIKEKRPI